MKILDLYNSTVENYKPFYAVSEGSRISVSIPNIYYSNKEPSFYHMIKKGPCEAVVHHDNTRWVINPMELVKLR